MKPVKVSTLEITEEEYLGSGASICFPNAFFFRRTSAIHLLSLSPSNELYLSLYTQPTYIKASNELHTLPGGASLYLSKQYVLLCTDQENISMVTRQWQAVTGSDKQ